MPGDVPVPPAPAAPPLPKVRRRTPTRQGCASACLTAHLCVTHTPSATSPPPSRVLPPAPFTHARLCRHAAGCGGHGAVRLPQLAAGVGKAHLTDTKEGSRRPAVAAPAADQRPLGGRGRGGRGRAVTSGQAAGRWTFRGRRRRRRQGCRHAAGPGEGPSRRRQQQHEQQHTVVEGQRRAACQPFVLGQGCAGSRAGVWLGPLPHLRVLMAAAQRGGEGTGRGRSSCCSTFSSCCVVGVYTHSFGLAAWDVIVKGSGLAALAAT